MIKIVGSNVVQSGPLAGLRLLRESSWGIDYSARLLGTYEKELHDTLEQILDGEVSKVVDVGCADGYYLVGLALRLPSAEFIGYDIDPEALRVSAELARLNGVSDRIELRGECTSASLCELGSDTLVVMDCEGAERLLVTQRVVSSSRRTKFLIECHETIVPGILERLEALFIDRRTYVVYPVARSADEAPALPAELAVEVLDEIRSLSNPWLIVS